MQFKYPEILYFLALLLIPILVHLFQLQRFVKTPFTNVAFLKKLALQTRKSSRIKKWLILTLRLLLITALITAFSQPYFSNKNYNKKQHNFIYLDNSLSTNTKGKKGDLLQISIQEIIENVSEKNNYSLLTNTNFHRNISYTELKKNLLKVKNTTKNNNLNNVLLKINTSKHNKTNTSNKNILITDFQDTYPVNFTNVNQQLSLIKLKGTQKNNIAIDSIFLKKKTTTNFKAHVIVSNQGVAVKNIPIAIYNANKLISKQTFNIAKDSTKTIVFPIQNSSNFSGKITLDFEDRYTFDNTFYFALNSNEKINVLAIGNTSNFLSKIYTKDEFNFTWVTPNKINYNTIDKQQLIILNELKKLPSTLISSITKFSKNGGNLIIIPNENTVIKSYNSLFKNLSAGAITSQTRDTLKISKINFSHPLLQNVFSKKITNFQYPNANKNLSSQFLNESTIVSFENTKAFIKQIKLSNASLFWFATPLNKLNSNFKNSPLIVPIFYNIGQESLRLTKLFYRTNTENTIDVVSKLDKDAVLSLQGNTTSFIPLQNKHQNKTTLTTTDEGISAGFYTVMHKEKPIKKIAFNNPKNESYLQFINTRELAIKNKNITTSDSLKKTLQENNQKNKIHWLWQWFLALAIVFLLTEILLLKYLKV